MKIIFCTNCGDLFSLSATKRKCMCKKTTAYILSGNIVYKGVFCIALDISIEDLLNIFGEDKTALTDEKCISAISKNLDDFIFCSKVLEYLNDQAETKYQVINGSATNAAIIQRRNQNKCTLEDFYRIIDRKILQWKGTNSAIYLRPATLFNKTKFENYLGEIGNAQPNTKSRFGKFTDIIESAKRSVSEDGQQNAQPGDNEQNNK